MDRIIWRCVSLGFGCGIALLMRPGLQAGQQPPPIGGVTGTIALEGTVDQEYKAPNTIAVKTLDGVRHLFHVTGKTLVHGGESAGADGLRGLEAGSAVVVHYSDD